MWGRGIQAVPLSELASRRRLATVRDGLPFPADEVHVDTPGLSLLARLACRKA